MIVVVAAYSPFDRAGLAHLGGARKIEAVIGILGGLDETVVLVNTAHNEEVRLPPREERTTIGGRTVLEITPDRYRRRPLGKLRNLFQAGALADRVLAHGRPRLVWIYNGYAMECLLVEAFVRRGAGRFVLELEDAAFARGRGLNPKPLVDWLLFRRVQRHLRHVFAVNEPLCRAARAFAPAPVLFPGIIHDGLTTACDAVEPFAAEGVRIGYFGGLTAEKGVDAVLALARRLPDGFTLHLSGAGALAADCRALADALGPGRVQFHGLVDDERLHALMASCDVLLNLHRSIAAMGDGVFPFKVIEYVAAGRLLVSTPVPGQGLERLLEGVRFVSGAGGEAVHDEALQAVCGARGHWQARRDLIREAALRARDRFGAAAIARQIRAVLAG